MKKCEDKIMNDQKITGSGTIVAGEYNDITVSGFGSIKGDVKANRIKIYGTLKSTNKVDVTKLSVSGSSTFYENVVGDNVDISGSATFDKNCSFKNISVNGSISCKEELTAEEIEVRGGCKLNKVEAKRVKLRGKAFNIKHLCAEELTIIEKGFSFGIIFSRNPSKIDVCECDKIDVDHLICDELFVKNGRIGPKCEIEYLEYSDSIDVHVDAKVKKIVKAVN